MKEKQKTENECSDTVQLKKKHPYQKLILNVFLWILIIFILSICSIALLIYFYQDEIKNLAINEVNKNLQTEVIINPTDIEVTFIKTFPDACIQFKNARILESGKKEKKEPIIKINDLRLHFSIIDILYGKYKINELSLYDSEIKYIRNEDGTDNFSILKKDTLKNVNDKMSFEINLITIKNIQLLYDDRKSKIKIDSKLKKFKFIINSMADIFDTEAVGEILFNYIINKSNKIIGDKDAVLSGRFIQMKSEWEIKDINIFLSHLNLNIYGVIKNIKQGFFGDLNFQIKQLEYKNIIPYLGDSARAKLKDFEVEGKINLEANLSGKFSDYSDLKIKSNFNVDDLNLIYKPNKIEFKHITFKGSFNKNINKYEVLKIKNIETKVQEIKLETDLSIINFSEPSYQVNSKIKGKIEDIFKTFKIDTTLEASGNLNGQFEISGKLKNLGVKYFLKENKSSLEINSLKLRPAKTENLIEITTGKINLTNNKLKLENLKIEAGKSSLILNGIIPELTDWLEDSVKTKAFDGNIKAVNLNWKDLSALLENSNEVSKNVKNKIPKNISLKISFSIENGMVENIILNDLTGNFEINHGKLLFDNLNFNQSNGRFKVNCLLSEEENKFKVKGYAEVDKMNISEAFKNFKNFGQNTLTHKNIKGIAKAKIDFIGELDENLNIKEKKIKSSCYLTIESGQLVEFAPLTGLSRFIELKELRDVKFSTLQTYLEINEGKIKIDRTTLENNALNINFSGTHDFNEELDYRVSLRLSELMAKRPGKKKELDEELNNVESDPENKRKVFIRIYGKLSDMKYKYDRTAAKEKIKEDIRMEKQNLKKILREEFGWFKNDSILNIKKKKKENKINEEMQFKFGNEINKKEEAEDGDF